MMLTVRRPSSTTHWDLPMRCPASAVLTAMLTAAANLATAAEPAMFRGDAPHRGVYEAAGVAVRHRAHRCGIGTSCTFMPSATDV